MTTISLEERLSQTDWNARVSSIRIDDQFDSLAMIVQLPLGNHFGPFRA
jgi:hypothetical protein